MPYDPDNPPDKVRNLSPKKQRQFVHVYNSCAEKGGDEKKCHMMAWGTVKKSATSKHADCGCGCNGAGTCQIPEVELEVKPRYRTVGDVTHNLISMAKEILATDVEA